MIQDVRDAIARITALADDTRIPYAKLVIALSALTTWFEIYVSRRQKPKYEIQLPPFELKDHLKPETFKKAQAYGKDKLTFAAGKTIFDWLVATGMINWGVYPWSWNATGNLLARFGFGPEYVITHSLLWGTCMTMLNEVLGLPWSYFYTFVVEEAHGFNKSTRTLFFTDKLKSWGVAAVIGLPVLAGFLKVIELAGNNFVPWLMLFLLVVQLALQIIFPIFIMPLFNKFTPVPDGEVRTRVEALASELKFPLKHLYVIDGSKRSSHSNAYFYGLPWSKQIVLFDTLIEKSTPAEVEAVLAHELGHWYLSHPTRLLLIAQGHLFFTLAIFSIFIHNKALFSSFGFDPSLAVQSPNGPPQPIMIGFVLYQLLFEPLDTLAKFFMNSKTRKYEYEADAFAVRLGKKKELADALIKLHIDNLSSPHNDKLYSAYHHSHPTLPERLKAMDDYTGTDWLVKKKSAIEEEEEMKEKKEL